MKKTIYPLASILLMILLGLASCTKEPTPLPDQPADTNSNNDTIPNINYPEDILGQWNAVLNNCYESYTEGDGYNETTYASDWASSLALTFKPDGKLTYAAIVGGVEDTWDDTYSISHDTLFWDTRPYKILTLNEHQLVFQFSKDNERTTSGGDILTTNVTKHYELTR